MNMKTILRYLSSFFTVAALFFVAGCSTVSISSSQYIGGPQFAPSNAADIQILREPPTRPHARLGEVRAESSSESVGVPKIEQALRNAAARMGADAIVIVCDPTQVTGAVITGPWYGRTIPQTTGRVIIGVAIKYTVAGS